MGQRPWTHQVVVGVDRRGDADGALRWAVSAATTTGAVLQIVHTIDRGGSSGPFAHTDWGVLAAAQAVVASRAPDLEVHCHLSWSSPWATLAEAADGAAGLVLGARGRDTWRDDWAHPVGHLIHSTSCPVVLVPRDWDAAIGDVVVGCDGTASSEESVGVTVQLSLAVGSPSIVLHSSGPARHGRPVSFDRTRPFWPSSRWG